jgi:molecular chaperone GrpE
MRFGEDEEIVEEAEETPEAAPAEAAEAAEAEPDDRTPLEVAQDEVAMLLGALQREKADFLNYKKRVHREKEDVRLAASRSWAETLLPVLDNLELALQSGGDHDTLKQGVQMILHEFDRALGMLGVESIAAEPGEAFDPDRHEAFGQVPHADHAPGTIAVVLQRGFSYHGRVLRAARVQVVAPNQEEPSDADV